ncbi:MAG: glycosyltransferase family 9 protein [Planctomycetes bacterium]|nr:glycosyltransferase family 9 protein [Planctomycetota bacterium]
MATPALRALRRAYPKSQLIVNGSPHLFPLLAGAGLFDDAIPAATRRASAREAAAALHASRADVAVIFPHSFRAAWEVFRARIPRRYGYRREWRRLLLTDSLAPHREGGRIVPVPMVHQYLELVGMLGAVGDGEGPRLAVTAEDRQLGDRALQALGLRDGDRLIAFNPGASFGPSKIWPIEHLAKVGDALQEEAGTRVAILCGPGEEELARRLEAEMRTPPLNTASAVLPLNVTKAVLARARLLITTDTGPRHIAIAVGTPAVVLMGPTDPRYTNSHLGATIVLRRDVPCGPCHLKVCPIDHRCMRWIGPDEVLAAARTLLEA